MDFRCGRQHLSRPTTPLWPPSRHQTFHLIGSTLLSGRPSRRRSFFSEAWNGNKVISVFGGCDGMDNRYALAFFPTSNLALQLGGTVADISLVIGFRYQHWVGIFYGLVAVIASAVTGLIRISDGARFLVFGLV